MEKIINYENLRKFAYSSDKICKKPIRGIVLEFIGLGGRTMLEEDPAAAVEYAEKGLVFVVPYHNPWAWMNRQTVDYVDEIIDVLMNYYQLPENLPIISTGGSMGGLSALVYTAYARRTPVACVANCPVCNLPYHYTERPDLPRTLYSAFGTYEGTMEQALQSASPVHLVDRMPDVAYYIFHCEQDLSVNKQKHSDVFVKKMSADHQVEYYGVPDRGHCDLNDEMRQLYAACITKYAYNL